MHFHRFCKDLIKLQIRFTLCSLWVWCNFCSYHIELRVDLMSFNVLWPSKCFLLCGGPFYSSSDAYSSSVRVLYIFRWLKKVSVFRNEYYRNDRKPRANLCLPGLLFLLPLGSVWMEPITVSFLGHMGSFFPNYFVHSCHAPETSGSSRISLGYAFIHSHIQYFTPSCIHHSVNKR